MEVRYRPAHHVHDTLLGADTQHRICCLRLGPRNNCAILLMHDLHLAMFPWFRQERDIQQGCHRSVDALVVEPPGGAGAYTELLHVGQIVKAVQMSPSDITLKTVEDLLE